MAPFGGGRQQRGHPLPQAVRNKISTRIPATAVAEIEEHHYTSMDAASEGLETYALLEFPHDFIDTLPSGRALDEHLVLDRHHAPYRTCRPCAEEGRQTHPTPTRPTALWMSSLRRTALKPSRRRANRWRCGNCSA
ncbi:hypothetical protein [Streptomyces sp. NRRL B-24572]|uniref:hypothetical protein n=1 Tax=Streptomyces sp. NRRL B-24572 TaxID=1962156 RepID=UPI0015C51CDE|nr:hypothetical protein [Streptomyces sp. NRRL B-24572]